jgi:hypothetical protein
MIIGSSSHSTIETLVATPWKEFLVSALEDGGANQVEDSVSEKLRVDLVMAPRVRLSRPIINVAPRM